MQWVLAKKFTFEAAHQLPNHKGKCSRLHGHSWTAYVYVEGDHLVTEGSESGMLMDYGTIKEVVKPWIDNYLDHHYLNETTQLENPTSEEIAKWLYERLKYYLPQLLAIRIDETCTSQCTYSERSSFASRISNEIAMG